MFDYSAPEQLLKDEIILVTGAGSGIGRTAAKTFAQYGATVILLGKTVTKLEAVYDEIEQENSPEPAIYPMNLEGATAKDFENLQVTLNNEFGHLDGILHNAVLLGTLMPIARFDMAHWGKIMQVNLNAPYMLTRTCLPLLEKSASASVVFTTDDVGIKGKAYWGAYAISKAAGDNMMQIFADEMEVNTAIRFNSINPGIVATNLRAKAYPGQDPSGLAKPADIMNAYLYLMGKDSESVNGEIIKAQS